MATTSDEGLLPSFLEAVPQPIWVGDESGAIVYSNAVAHAVLAWSLDAMRGRSGHAVVHHMHRDGSPFPESECMMLAPRIIGETLHCDDDWFIRRDGSFVPISWWSAPIQLPSGRGVVVAFTDVTEQRELERTAGARDAAEVRAAESRAAQRRIMEGVSRVHRQTVRNLHDGAQQRLVAC